jgi:hypothetical protein
VQRGGTYALGLNVVNGSVTDVVVDTYIVKTPSTGVFSYNAAGGEAGNRTLNFKLHGTAPATIETLTAGSPKWSVLDLESGKYYSSAKQELVGTAFTAGESNDGTLQISGLKGTAGSGNYTGAITFSAAGSSRRRAAIAGWQPTANGGQGGLCILTKSTTTTSSDALTPRIYIDHLGNVILNMSASVTPADNGQLMLEATSDTSLTFKYKGSDGVVRSASLTLS